jgi:hypothetical protein
MLEPLGVKRKGLGLISVLMLCALLTTCVLGLSVDINQQLRVIKQAESAYRFEFARTAAIQYMTCRVREAGGVPPGYASWAAVPAFPPDPPGYHCEAIVSEDPVTHAVAINVRIVAN